MIIAWTLYVSWAVLTLGWLAIIVWQITRKHVSKLNLFSVIPIATLIPFSYVFIFNEGSNVAQFTDRKDLWGFWYECYMPLFFGNAIGLGCFLLFLTIPLFWKKMRTGFVWHLKLIMLTSMALSLYHVLISIPDC